MTQGIYCYYDKENDYISVYIGKDSYIHKNKRHKEHLQTSKYDEQVINRVLQNNPDRYEYRVICEYPDLSDNELNWFECMEIMKHRFLYEEKPNFNFTVGGDGITGYRKPYEDFIYTVAKIGFHKGKQRYTVFDRNHNSIKVSIDKNFIIDLVEKLNNGEITEEEAKAFKYTIAKMGFYNGKQQYTVRDKNDNSIKVSIDKDFIANLVEKLNNGEITEEEAREAKPIYNFVYTVAKSGFNNGRQQYVVNDREHNPIKRSINKNLIIELVKKLNNREITEEEAKKAKRKKKQ